MTKTNETSRLSRANAERASQKIHAHRAALALLCAELIDAGVIGSRERYRLITALNRLDAAVDSALEAAS